MIEGRRSGPVQNPGNDTFEAALSDWADWQESPWGRLRYTIAAANLMRHLSGSSLRVLDLGGGSGLDAIPLAALGHHVTVVDYAEGMLAQAQEHAARGGLEARVATVLGDFEDVPLVLETRAFDVVLCHNVLQYLKDPQASLEVVVEAARPGGLVSLMCPNGQAEPLRLAIRDLVPDAAFHALDAEQMEARAFGVMVHQLVAADLIPTLVSLGCHIDGQYGIRCVCDYIVDERRKEDPDFFRSLEKLELSMSTRPAYAAIARFFHLVAIKS